MCGSRVTKRDEPCDRQPDDVVARLLMSVTMTVAWPRYGVEPKSWLRSVLGCCPMIWYIDHAIPSQDVSVLDLDDPFAIRCRYLS